MAGCNGTYSAVTADAVSGGHLDGEVRVVAGGNVLVWRLHPLIGALAEEPYVSA